MFPQLFVPSPLAVSHFCFPTFHLLLLANTACDPAQVHPEWTKTKRTIPKVRPEQDAAGQRFAAAGDLVARLFAEEKRQRILAAAERWLELPASLVAIVAGASPGYVSKVLREGDGRQLSRSSEPSEY